MLAELEEMMPMIANSWGSKCLTGAGSLSYRMPAVTGFHRSLSDIAQTDRATD